MTKHLTLSVVNPLMEQKVNPLKHIIPNGNQIILTKACTEVISKTASEIKEKYF